jgi:hypothetical protein
MTTVGSPVSTSSVPSLDWSTLRHAIAASRGVRVTRTVRVGGGSFQPPAYIGALLPKWLFWKCRRVEQVSRSLIHNC